MGKIFDTHAHYDDEAFEQDREELLKSLLEGDVCGIVNQGTTVESSRFSLELASRFENVYAAVGIHPECVNENSLAELEEICRMASHPKAVAIGEIGLDYYYDVPKLMQQEAFASQLEMANGLSMPVNIHDREAHGDTLEFLRRYRPKGILHCFSGSAEMARQVASLGMYIGIGGVITFKNARKTVEVVQALPLERIVLETDCPYLAPVPYRGKRNHSGLILHSAQRLAEIKGTSLEEVLEITRRNAELVYGIKRKTEKAGSDKL